MRLKPLCTLIAIDMAKTILMQVVLNINVIKSCRASITLSNETFKLLDPGKSKHDHTPFN